jgi:hypothetical protein
VQSVVLGDVVGQFARIALERGGDDFGKEVFGEAIGCVL